VAHEIEDFATFFGEMASLRFARPVNMMVAATPMVCARYGKGQAGRKEPPEARIVFCDDSSSQARSLTKQQASSIRAALAVNSKLKRDYPTMLLGIVKGFFDPSKMIENHIMIPVLASVPVTEKVVRSRHAVTSEVKIAIYERIEKNFPDPAIATTIAGLMADKI